MSRTSRKTQPLASTPLQTPRPASATIPVTQSNRSWRDGVFFPAVISSLLLWAAFPPLGVAWLAWLAPLGWLLVCQRQLPVGGRGYVSLWISGCLFWLLILQGVRLAYWPLIFGWLALSFYLAIYLPLFVAVTRAMVWGWKCPLVIAAPVTWVGLEQIRSHLLTGFAANTLAHTQVPYPPVIQIADQLGGGGIGFVMMTLAAAVLPGARNLLRGLSGVPSMAAEQLPSRLATALWAGGLVSVTLGYGMWRLAEADRLTATARPLLRVLLVQENTPSMFDNYSPERNQSAWEAYLERTRLGIVEHGPVDLIVWPESTFTGNAPWVEQHLTDALPAEVQRQQVDREHLLSWVEEMQSTLRHKVDLVHAAVRQAAAESSHSPVRLQSAAALDPAAPVASVAGQSSGSTAVPYLMVGSDVLVVRSERVERFNAALLIGREGELLERYGKRHLVMFGEYIPLGPVLEWLRQWVNLAGLDAGTEFESFQVGRVRVAPNICFESMLPHLISAQVRQLAAQGEAPDVLVNITNDSWFRGSSILDHHLACSRLTAVENRRPLLVAANTGLSAHIDGSGRLLACTQRLKAEALLAEPRADGRWGLVQTAGYPLGWGCAIATALVMIWGSWLWLARSAARRRA